MKKSIAILLALVLMMTVVLFGCGKKEDEEANGDATSQQAPAEGSSDNSTTSEGGDTSADITDATASTDANGTTDAAGTTDVTGTTDETDTTNATTPSKPDFTPSQPDNSQQTVVPQSSAKIEKYRQIFASGNYSMTITSADEGSADIPVEFACKNGNLRMSMEMEGFPAIMIHSAENNTTYILIEFMGKFYTELTEELMGEELDLSDAAKNFEIPANAVITEGTGTLDGKTYATETVTTSTKSTVFYFDNYGTLIATESEEDNGSKSVTKLSNISTDVDDSLFEIPEEYTYMDFSWLMNMA